MHDDEPRLAVPDAAPLVPPPALNIPVVDTPVNLGVNALYALMFGANTAFMAGFWASEVGTAAGGARLASRRGGCLRDVCCVSADTTHVHSRAGSSLTI
jgi:hypothetical protein